MMNFLSHLVKAHREADATAPSSASGVASYESVVNIRSQAMPAVLFSIHRISFGRRMELARQVRELSQKAEFLQAGTELQDKIDANLLKQEIEAIYIRWGLVRIDGLKIDGEPATAERLIEKGPEELTREVVTAIKAQCGLSEEERKNS
ncbi:MAG TPA: hypothetical protein VKX49_28800 [Bryobacteraceae bacterium]|nr:hypothetical protein [Bryobacteraceae bacterium]